jgi:hypothetical protein
MTAALCLHACGTAPASWQTDASYRAPASSSLHPGARRRPRPRLPPLCFHCAAACGPSVLSSAVRALAACTVPWAHAWYPALERSWGPGRMPVSWHAPKRPVRNSTWCMQDVEEEEEGPPAAKDVDGGDAADTEAPQGEDGSVDGDAPTGDGALPTARPPTHVSFRSVSQTPSALATALGISCLFPSSSMNIMRTLALKTWLWGMCSVLAPQECTDHLECMPARICDNPTGRVAAIAREASFSCDCAHMHACYCRR